MDRLNIDWPLLLCTDLDTPRRLKVEVGKPTLTVHPDSGFEDGALVVLKTKHGKVEGQIQHCSDQHIRAVICSSSRHPSILNVLDATVYGRSGAVVLNGEPCRLESLRGV